MNCELPNKISSVERRLEIPMPPLRADDLGSTGRGAIADSISMASLGGHFCLSALTSTVEVSTRGSDAVDDLNRLDRVALQ